MEKRAYAAGPYTVLVLEDFGKHCELQFDMEDTDHIDLYTIAELNRHDRVCDEHWFSNATLWERYRYAFFNRPTLEIEKEYVVESPFVDEKPTRIREHVSFASRKERR